MARLSKSEDDVSQKDETETLEYALAHTPISSNPTHISSDLDILSYCILSYLDS